MTSAKDQRRGPDTGLLLRPLRVLVDARMLIGRFSGVSRYVTCLIEQLRRRSDIHVIGLCGAGWTNDIADHDRAQKKVETIDSGFRKKDRSAHRRWWWEARNLATLIRSAKIDVYHATWNSGIPPFCSVPAVLTIHDLIPLHEPDEHFSTRLQQWSYRRSLRASLRRAAFVTTVSDHVREEVLRSCSVASDRIATVHNGVIVSNIPRIAEGNGNEDYVLYVGGHQPRKNLAGLLQAMETYWYRFGDGLHLRLTGTRESLCARAARVHENLVRPEWVHFLGDVSESELTRQYIGARALLMLSRDEGFGLPVLEAMAHGCPVVAADRSSLPEIAGRAALLVNPDDPEAAAAAIRRMVCDHNLRQELIRLGIQRAAEFTWESAANKMTRIYRHVARSHDSEFNPSVIPNVVPVS